MATKTIQSMLFSEVIIRKKKDNHSSQLGFQTNLFSLESKLYLKSQFQLEWHKVEKGLFLRKDK